MGESLSKSGIRVRVPSMATIDLISIVSTIFTVSRLEVRQPD